MRDIALSDLLQVAPWLTQQVRWYTEADAWAHELTMWWEGVATTTHGGDRWFLTHNRSPEVDTNRNYSGLVWHVLARPELRAQPPVMLSLLTAQALLEIDPSGADVYLLRNRDEVGSYVRLPRESAEPADAG